MNGRFESRLAEGAPIVADGGMGALLTAAVPRLRTTEEANLRAPEAVVSLHVSFINAGAELIETNTFGANRRKLAHNFLDDDLEALNSAGVKLAREAREVTGREVFIGGRVGPLGAAAALPNVGLASLACGRVIYPHATPEYFAEFAAHARDLGAKVIGGCCGTTPAEIAAIRSAVEDERRPRAPLVFESPELVVALGEEQKETGLSRALAAGEWVVSVQLDPPLGGNSVGLLEVASTLQESGRVGWVDVNDNATARAGMSSLMVSATIERRAQIETIPHLTTRDCSVMGLESMLPGAHSEGVRNVLAITGDPPEVGDYPGARGVYEIDAIGLTQLMTNLNRGEDFNGRPIDAPTSFFPGVAVNPTPDDMDVELERFEQKLDAGAKFAMTQIVFDVDYLDRFVERIGGTWPIPVLIGIFPLTSYRLAQRLHNEVPGIVVPDELQQALETAGSDAAEVGFAHAKDVIAASRDRAAGVYLVAPFRRPLRVLELLD